MKIKHVIKDGKFVHLVEEEGDGYTDEGCEECSDELGREYVIGEDIEFAEEDYIDAEDVEEKPYPNEHACRLLPPGNFDRFARKNCFRRSGGKCIDFIFGIKAGKSKTQAMRYKKTVWTASAARAHCKGADGTFEAAGKSGEKIYVYSVNGVMEKVDMERIKKDLRTVLGEDAKIVVLDSGASLTYVEDGDVDIVQVSEKRIADEKTDLEKLKIRAEELWDVQITDDLAEVLMVLSEKMDLDIVKSVLDVAGALDALKPKGDEDLDELDETAALIESALKSQTEELKSTMEKIIDEVVDRVVRAVRTTFSGMRENKEDIHGNEILEDDEIDDLEDEDLNDEDGSEETDADDEVDAEIDEDEMAAVVSDSFKEALGRLE